MGKTIIPIHGRDMKPQRVPLEKLWRDALRWGVQRDYPGKLTAYDKCTIEFVYYGDISNTYLEKKTGKPAPGPADVISRQKTLDELKRLKTSEFTRARYNKLPGKSAVKEALADALGATLSFFRLSDPLIGAVAPDMTEYWNEETDYGTDVRYPLIAPLSAAMDRGDSICVVAHSLGTMISYDTFWKFCRLGEYRPHYTNKKIDLFISLGSPLADETVKRKLKGASIDGERRYPCNIVRWVNIAAEDDYVSHDGKVADDYHEMLKLKLVKSITDVLIYNLSLRNGQCNPHHEGGYLIHPEVATAVANWV